MKNIYIALIILGIMGNVEAILKKNNNNVAKPANTKSYHGTKENPTIIDFNHIKNKTFKGGPYFMIKDLPSKKYSDFKIEGNRSSVTYIPSLKEIRFKCSKKGTQRLALIMVSTSEIPEEFKRSQEEVLLFRTPRVNFAVESN